MKLLTKCTSCRQQIKVKSIASTRPELASEKGDEFNIICTHCASNIKVHANDVEAFPNSTFLFLFLF